MYERTRSVAEGRGDASEVDEPCASHRLPVHVAFREPSESRVTPVVQHADRPWGHPILEEIDTDAGVLGRADVRAVDAVPHELAPDPVAPLVRGKRGDPRHLQAEPRAGRRDVRLGAADLDVKLACGLEAGGRRDGQAQEHLAEGDEVVHLERP